MSIVLVAAAPPWLPGLVLFTVVALLVAAVGVVVLSRRPAAERAADGPSLGEEADRVIRSQSGMGRVDADFDRIVRGSQLGLSGEAAAAGIVIGGALAATVVYLATFDFLMAGASGLIAALGLFGILWFLQDRRRRAIQEQLPDGIFQLARSLRSGLNLPAGLRETTSYVPNPLSDLFAKLAVAVSLGESTRAAARRVADDARVTEFDLLTEVIALNSEAGGNLPTMLDRLAASIRDRNQYRGYFRSTTTLTRFAAFFLALAAPVAFVAYLIFPDQRVFMLEFLAAPQGPVILAIAAGLWLLGVVWIALLLRRQDDY